MAISRRQFPKVSKTNGVPKKYVKGSKNPAKTKKEIKSTASKYKKGTLTKEDMNKVVKQRVASTKMKKGGEVKKKKSGGSAEATLKKYASQYNMPVGTLRKVMKRGQGAYFSSGSRPGQTPTSWGLARAKSFASGKGGARKADKDLYDKVKGRRKTT
jgi:hypothetical protein